MKNFIIKLIILALFITLLPANIALAEEKQKGKADSISQNNSQKQVNKIERKEEIGKRTDKTKTFKNINGSLTTEIYQSPVHYKDPQTKQWIEIDNTIEKEKNTNNFTNTKNIFDIDFPEELTFEQPIMDLQEGNLSVELSPIYIEGKGKKPKKAKAKVKGNTITYEEAYENTDLSYSVGNEKIKEDIILKKKPSKEENISYSFSLNLKGLTHEVQENGEILLKDKKTEEILYYIEKSFMFDSIKPEGFTGFSESSVPEEALSYDVATEVQKKGNKLLITIVPNKEWLLADERVYPIIIDPTIVKYQPVTDLVDTNVRSALPTQTGGTDTEIGAGLYKNSSTNNVIRSLMKFDVSDIPAGVKVLDAQLNLWASSVWNDTSVRLDLHPVTSTWDENTATWNKRTASATWGVKGGDYSPTTFSSQNVGALGSTLNSNQYKWAITPSYLEKIINSSASDNGFLLKSASEGTAAYKKFFSGDNLEYAGYSPLLSITYITNSRLGLEDYWTYDEQELSNGEAYINLGTGNGVFHFTDFSITGRGNSLLSFERTYNSKAAESDSFGPGWSFTGSESITEQIQNKSINYTDRDGTVHTFLYNIFEGNYRSPSGMYSTLTKEGADVYKLSDKYGNISRFKKNNQDSHTSGYSIAKLESEKDRNGNTILYTYNSVGKLTKITDASGKEMAINQGPMGISSISFEGKKYTYHYNFEGYLEEVREYKDSTNYTSTSFSYNSAGKLEKIIDANKKGIVINYKDGFVESIQKLLDVKEINQPLTTYSYDIKNFTAEVKDPEGGVTKYELDNNYVVLAIENPVGGIFSNDELDGNYNPKKTTDAESNETFRLFDSKGNLIQETDPKGSITNYSYDQFSNILSINDSKGTVKFSYDTKGNLESVTDQNDNTTKYAYDGYGSRISTTFADGSQEKYEYSGLNQSKIVNIDPIGRRTETSKNAYDDVTSIKNPKGHITNYTYDQKQLLKSVVNANNKTTSYEHDENGNLVSVKNANGKETKMLYNDQNQLIQSKLPMGETTLVSYDYNGNLISTIKPSNSTIYNNYNDANQLTSIYEGNQEKWSFTYDDNGNTDSITDAETKNTKQYYYDENDNLINESYSNIFIDYSYNEANELSSFTGKSNNNIFKQSYLTNNTGLLEEFKRNDQVLANFKYNNKGLPTSLNFSNGTSVTYSFDKAQQLEELIVENNNSKLLVESFDYDLNGNITLINSTNNNSTFSYDSLNQLISQSLGDNFFEEYEYDDVGNRTKKLNKKDNITTSYTYNDNNQLIGVGTTKYIYDKNGNRIKDGSFIYNYNVFDEIINITDLNGNEVVSYKYDETGRRTSKNIGGKVTNYHYGQGINVLFETNAHGTITAEYSYDQNGFPLTFTKNEETFFYILNGHKDVVALTNANGAIVASYIYDAWGNIIEQSGEIASENPYRYAGYRYDNETNNYYLTARYYNPAEGVFLSLDPVAGETTNPQTLNGYNYANNNPVMYIDPEGEAIWWLAPAIVGGVLNALPVILEYVKKHKTLKGINWWKVGAAFSVGAITSIGGAGLYRAIGKAGGNLLTRVIGMASYAPKAYILNTVAKGKKPTFNGLYTAYLSGGIVSGLSLVKRAQAAWKYGGAKALRRYIRAIK